MRKYVPFFLILLMMFIIFGLSAVDGATSYDFSRVIAKFIKSIMDIIVDNNFSITTIDMVIRKLAHFFEYLILTILLFISFSNIKLSRRYSLLISAVISVLVSIVDEGVIQNISGRNNNIFDVMVDCTGIITAVIIFAINIRLKVKVKAESEK
ncbi:MAG: VanZ family protein [Ruminiclostridium sp.]|nr:VanZ family protein [Ruminiclostridium sp.]